jgi:glutamate transport system substrate-binding protein
MRITRLAATFGAMALVLAGAACGGTDSGNSNGSGSRGGGTGVLGMAASG